VVLKGEASHANVIFGTIVAFTLLRTPLEADECAHVSRTAGKTFKRPIKRPRFETTPGASSGRC